MKRIFNFGAGPAILPVSVLERASCDVLELADSGMSILETSHRGAEYEKIHFGAQTRLLKLMGLSAADYTVFFLGGGASQQFAMLPMNFLAPGASADYVHTGEWAIRAIQEARHYGDVNVAGSSEAGHFSFIPKELKRDPSARYLHFTSNNTIEGTQWKNLPLALKGVPMIADASSDFLSGSVDFGKFAMLYAGAQKNLGPAGVTIVVMRKSFLATAREDIPNIFSYKTHAKADSLYNTPPVFSVYVIGLVLEWIENQGGLAGLGRRNQRKAEMIYSALDDCSDLYECACRESGDRSLMNITFRLRDSTRETEFLAGAQALGMEGLKGHRSVGGFRASVYNAFPEEGCVALAGYLKSFARQ